MIQMLVEILLMLLSISLVCGLIFSGYFLLAGIKKMDVDTVDSPWHFKLIIWPGSILLWVFLLKKLKGR